MASGAAAQVSEPSHGLRRHRTPGLPSGHGSPPGAAGPQVCSVRGRQCSQLLLLANGVRVAPQCENKGARPAAHMTDSSSRKQCTDGYVAL